MHARADNHLAPAAVTNGPVFQQLIRPFSAHVAARNADTPRPPVERCTPLPVVSPKSKQQGHSIAPEMAHKAASITSGSMPAKVHNYVREPNGGQAMPNGRQPVPMRTGMWLEHEIADLGQARVERLLGSAAEALSEHDQPASYDHVHSVPSRPRERHPKPAGISADADTAVQLLKPPARGNHQQGTARDLHAAQDSDQLPDKVCNVHFICPPGA